MTFYAILITFMFAFLLGVVATKLYLERQSQKRYHEMFGKPADYSGKRKKLDTEGDLDALVEEDDAYMDRVKDTLGATVLSYEKS